MGRVRNYEDDSPEGPKKKKSVYHTPMRTRVITLLDEGLPPKRIFEKTGVPTRTINRWKKDPHVRRSLQLHNHGARPIISAEEEDRMISLLETEGWKMRVLKWAELAKEAQLEFEVHPQTVQRHLNARGYFKCRACSKIFLRKENVEERQLFAASRQPEDYPLAAWTKHVFHDEVHFCLNSRKQVFIIRNEKQRYHPHCLQNRLKRGTNILHFAGLIGWGWKGPFKEIQQTGPGGGYTQWDFERDLDQWILDAVWDREKALGIRHASKQGRLKLEIDGDSSHGKKKKSSAGRWMLDHNDVVYYFNPGKSPDLSPIEQIWGVMKEFIKKKKPTNENELRAAIVEAWATQVTTQLINKCIRSMPERMRQLAERKGGPTRW